MFHLFKILINMKIYLKQVIKKLFFISTIAFISYSCNNEIDINADLEDTTIVYGVLNPNEQRQFIRINRAFLTDGDANQAAQIPDSSNYPFKLNVKIHELNRNGQIVNTFNLDTIHLPKESGAFNVGMQPYYFFDLPNIHRITNFNNLSADTVFMNTENSFKLEIQNPVTGKIIESSTPLIPDINIQRPAYFSTLISFVSTTKTGIEFKSVPNGRIYQAKFVFFYREVDVVNNPNDTIYKQLEWNIGTVKSRSTNGNESLLIPYIPYSFFSQLKSRIPNNPNIKRFHGIMFGINRVDVQFVMSVGADELNTYIDVNKPSTSIIQERPIYTNISNGIGIFSSKRSVRFNYAFNTMTLDSLKNGSTFYLNFN